MNCLLLNVFVALTLTSVPLMAWTAGPITSADQWLAIMQEPQLRGYGRSFTPGEGDFFVAPPARTGEKVSVSPIQVSVRGPDFADRPVDVIRLSPPDGDARAQFDHLVCRLRQKKAEGRAARVILAPGRYRFLPPDIHTYKPRPGNCEVLGNFSTPELRRTVGNPSIDLSGLENVTLRGSSTDDRSVLEFTNPFSPGIRVSDSSRVRIADLVIDYDYSLTVRDKVYGQVALPARALGDNSIRFIDAIFAPADVGAVFSFNSVRKTYFTSALTPAHISLESDTTLPVAAGRTLTHSKFRALTAGESLVVLHTRRGYANAVEAKGDGNEDIAFVGLRILTYPQMGIKINGGKRGFLIRDNHIAHAEGSAMPVSGRADGINVSGTGGDVAVVRNRVFHNGDDSLNVRGSDLPITGISADSVFSRKKLTFQPGTDFVVAPGHWLALANNDVRPFHLVRVTGVSGNEITVDWGSCNQACATGVMQNLNSTKVVDGVSRKGAGFNLSRVTGGYVVLNNEFGHNGGRGMLLAAPNGRVVNNVLADIPNACLLLHSQDNVFSEGPGPSDVGIFGNRLIRCGMKSGNTEAERDAGVAISALTGAETFPLIQRILFSFNVLTDIPSSGVRATRAQRIEVTHNRFTRLATTPGTQVIGQSPSARIYQMGNTVD